MVLRQLVSLTASVAVLGSVLAPVAPAWAQSTPSDLAEIGPSMDEKSSYGEFLTGRRAMHTGMSAEAAERLAAAADRFPNDRFLRERAFMAALFTGNVTLAAKYAPPLNPEQPALESLGRLTRATEAFASGRAEEATQLLSGEKILFPHATAAHLLKPWALAAAGRWDEAVADPGDAPDRIAALFATVARAQILETRKRPDEAEALWRTLAEERAAGGMFVGMYGEFLERRGRRDEALALYQKGLEAQPDDLELQAAKARVERRGKPPKLPNLTEGAGEAMGYAAAVMSASRQPELALAYLRLALRINPNQDTAWLVVGDILSNGRAKATARDAWAQVKPDSALYSEARAKIIYSLQEAGEKDAALAMAQETLKQRPNDLRARLTVADLLRAHGRDAEAVTVLDGLIREGVAGWRPYYLRAMAYDRLDRWPEAEADLLKAMELAPDEPELLNYLGYAWIDRGQKVQEGMALVERAVAARPQSGAMQDSLAWAHFRLGDYPKAVELLERAVTLAPADPEVNNHLGDAYWMVGRKDEARFQWNRVLSLQPTEEVKAEVERKLKDGLPPPSRAAGS